jgi:hypothetical protein
VKNLEENGGTPCARASAAAGEDASVLNPAAIIAVFRNYLTTLKRDPSTIKMYVYGLRCFFAFLERKGLPDLRAVTRAHLLEYQAELSGKTWTTNTVHAHLRAVRRVYEYLEDQGKILMNPTAGIRMPKLERPLPRNVLTRSEMRRLLDAPDTSLPSGIRDRAMMEVFYSTGIRVAELCHLTIHDVDLLNGYLRVNCGKGCKDRVVPRRAGGRVRDKARQRRAGEQEARRLRRRASCGTPSGAPAPRGTARPGGGGGGGGQRRGVVLPGLIAYLGGEVRSSYAVAAPPRFVLGPPPSQGSRTRLAFYSSPLDAARSKDGVGPRRLCFARWPLAQLPPPAGPPESVTRS